MTTTTTLQTPFGSFRGKQHDGAGVVQYLGIPYARVKNQLCVPEMVGSYDEVVDATEYGPRAPSIPAPLFEQQHLVQQTIDTSPPPRMSGTECLNLNMTMPSLTPSPSPSSEEKEKGLPVMVFIHGGGFIMGSNSAAYFDPTRLVKLSVEVGQPVMVVSINYRLGVLGNLSGEELRREGYPGNNSLRDQQCALRWVKKYIGGFGGNAENVTAFGVSAGAVSVLAHLASKEPLFTRAIAMSGTPLMLPPISPSAAEDTYNNVMKAFGLENASAEERVQHLISLSPEELVEKTPMGARPVPCVDEDVVPGEITFESLASRRGSEVEGMRWCKDVMLGDTKDDGTISLFMGLSSFVQDQEQTLASRIHASFTTTLGPSPATAVLDAYNITRRTPNEAALPATFALATDMLYAMPTMAFARSWPGNAYVYHFDAPNPWEGPLQGCATHMLDAVFLFQNFEERMVEWEREVARALAKDFVRFANGVVPWEEFCDGDGEERGRAKVFGAGAGAGGKENKVVRMVGRNGWGHGRRNTLAMLVGERMVDLDKLRGAWEAFLGGK